MNSRKILKAKLDEMTGLMVDEHVDRLRAESERDELKARLAELERERDAIDNLRRAQLASEEQRSNTYQQRAEAAERERDAYRKAKAENDDRFQIEAAEQRQRAEAAERRVAELERDVHQARAEWFEERRRCEELTTRSGDDLRRQLAELQAACRAKDEALRPFSRGTEVTVADMQRVHTALTATPADALRELCMRVAERAFRAADDAELAPVAVAGMVVDEVLGSAPADAPVVKTTDLGMWSDPGWDRIRAAAIRARGSAPQPEPAREYAPDVRMPGRLSIDPRKARDQNRDLIRSLTGPLNPPARETCGSCRKPLGEPNPACDDPLHRGPARETCPTCGGTREKPGLPADQWAMFVSCNDPFHARGGGA